MLYFGQSTIRWSIVINVLVKGSTFGQQDIHSFLAVLPELLIKYTKFEA